MAGCLQAMVVDPIKGAPESVRRLMQPDRLCVMFFGPAFNKVSILLPVGISGHDTSRLPRLRFDAAN